MIIHRYSEYEEPREPPFTLDDVIRSVTELMMRYHVGFNEALRHLLDSGLPLNEFLRDDNLDHILDEYIEKVEKMKEELKTRHDYSGFTKEQRDRFEKIAGRIRKQAEDDPAFLEKLDEAARNRSVPKFYELRGGVRRRRDFDEELVSALENAIRQVELLERVEKFHEWRGHQFTGPEKLDINSAGEMIGQYIALETLYDELVEARNKGSLFDVDEKRLREILGGEAYERFAEAREKLMETLSEAMQATGQVEEDNGIFKLTPAAARKVGDTTLREVYAALKIDGTGGHVVSRPGEGSAEQVSTRPYEYGDSLTHLDVPASMINALVRGGSALPIRLSIEDLEVHETRGVARSAIAVMIDMSGSMSRFGRFYNAKRMALALDALVRSNYPEDTIHFIGFATFARRIHVSRILELGPEPITFMGGAVNMKVDFDGVEDVRRDLPHVPRYFTNIQKGLSMARQTLVAEPGLNKEILLITDGAPTAYYEGRSLYLTYPPEERAYAATLREARACAEEGVTINAFLLGSDWDTGFYGEEAFVMRMMKISRGRLFHPQPDSLTEYVLHDYISNRRKVFEA